MAPRRYDSTTRRDRQRALRDRIAAATAELHAEKGGLATRYADIAQRAGVSLPTVYSYFPDQDTLVEACTAHVRRQAPAPDAASILAAPDLAAAARALVDAMDRLNAFMAPWMAWREDRAIPFLERMNRAIREQQRTLIREVLVRHLGPGEHEPAVAAWESVVHFDLWDRLVHGHALARDAAKSLQLQMLLAVTGPRPAATHTPGPKKDRS